MYIYIYIYIYYAIRFILAFSYNFFQQIAWSYLSIKTSHRVRLNFACLIKCIIRNVFPFLGNFLFILSQVSLSRINIKMLWMSYKPLPFIGVDYWKISISIQDMTIWQHSVHRTLLLSRAIMHVGLSSISKV